MLAELTKPLYSLLDILNKYKFIRMHVRVSLIVVMQIFRIMVLLKVITIMHS